MILAAIQLRHGSISETLMRGLLYTFVLVVCVVTLYPYYVMLVSAFMGREQALAAYREAVEKRYRFFSFGDAMYIETVRE